MLELSRILRQLVQFLDVDIEQISHIILKTAILKSPKPLPTSSNPVRP